MQQSLCNVELGQTTAHTVQPGKSSANPTYKGQYNTTIQNVTNKIQTLLISAHEPQMKTMTMTWNNLSLKWNSLWWMMMVATNWYFAANQVEWQGNLKKYIQQQEHFHYITAILHARWSADFLAFSRNLGHDCLFSPRHYTSTKHPAGEEAPRSVCCPMASNTQ